MFPNAISKVICTVTCSQMNYVTYKSYNNILSKQDKNKIMDAPLTILNPANKYVANYMCSVYKVNVELKAFFFILFSWRGSSGGETDIA